MPIALALLVTIVALARGGYAAWGILALELGAAALLLWVVVEVLWGTSSRERQHYRRQRRFRSATTDNVEIILPGEPENEIPPKPRDRYILLLATRSRERVWDFRSHCSFFGSPCRSCHSTWIGFPSFRLRPTLFVRTHRRLPRIPRPRASLPFSRSEAFGSGSRASRSSSSRLTWRRVRRGSSNSRCFSFSWASVSDSTAWPSGSSAYRSSSAETRPPPVSEPPRASAIETTMPPSWRCCYCAVSAGRERSGPGSCKPSREEGVVSCGVSRRRAASSSFSGLVS